MSVASPLLSGGRSSSTSSPSTTSSSPSHTGSSSSSGLVLSATQLHHLLGLLSPESARSLSVETLTQRRATLLGAHKGDAFKVGLAILQLLMSGDLLFLSSAPQRLAALLLLHDLFKAEPAFSLNPFAAVFVHALNPRSETEGAGMGDNLELPAVARQFISLLITGQATPDFFKKTPKAICAGKELEIDPVDLTGIQLGLAERESELPATARNGVSPLVPSTHAQTEQRKIVERLLLGDDAPMTQSLTPRSCVPAPPLFLDEEEALWLNPSDHLSKHHSFMYDPTMCEVSASANEAKRLMAKALNCTLTLGQQQQLKSELERDPTIAYQTGLVPHRLPELVENNPLIAIEVLLRLMDSPQITEFFSVLVNMEMSLHSMEVVNR